jgi:exo-1,4-beta-D-glucosaminidase
MLRLRQHPSVLVWLYGSDEAPPVYVEAAYLDTAARVAWPNPLLASAADTTSPLSGPTGVKMSGPYRFPHCVFLIGCSARM